MAFLDRSKVESMLIARLQAQMPAGIVSSTVGDAERKAGGTTAGSRSVRITAVDITPVTRSSSAGTQVGRLQLVIAVTASEADGQECAWTAAGDAQRVLNAMTQVGWQDTDTGHTINLGEGRAEEATLAGDANGASPRARAVLVTIEGLVVRTAGVTILSAPPAGV